MHWKVPTTLVAAYVGGIGFAYGHHLFYQSLNGKHVESTTFDQQINSGIGTAFAFLVRSCLILAIGVAFTQVLWRDLLLKPIRVSSIDSVTQLLSSLPEIFNIVVLRKHPLLGFITFVSWTLPIAVVVPPATLAVSTPQDAFRNSTLREVPIINYNSTSFFRPGNATGSDDDNISVFYQSSSTELSRLALRTAIDGDITPIPTSAQNYSYNLQLHGPALKCANTSVINLGGPVPGTECSPSSDNYNCPAFSYFAWAPEASVRIPFGNLSVDNNPNTRSAPANQSNDLDMVYKNIGGYAWEPASLYIGLVNQGDDTWPNFSVPILNCSLYNASYDIAFAFGDSLQAINATKQLLNGMPFTTYIEWPQPPDQAAIESAWSNPLTWYLRYEAIMEAFGRVLVGSITSSRAQGFSLDDLARINSTSILSTNFIDCTVDRDYDSFSPTCFAIKAEQLFENITLSLFSSENFTSLSTANVTLLTYPNTYIYTRGRLILAYGLAVFFTGICVVIAGISIMVSGKSYSYTFSTIIRTTRQKAIDKYIDEKHKGGADPRPERLARAKIVLGELSESSAADTSEEISLLRLRNESRGVENGDRLSQSSAFDVNVDLNFFESPLSRPVPVSEELVPGDSPRHRNRPRTRSPVSDMSPNIGRSEGPNELNSNS